MKVTFDYYNGYHHVVLEAEHAGEDAPKIEEYLYSCASIGDATLYWAFCPRTGFVSFFYHTPHNETGFGGSTYKLHMQDGTTRTIKGPWSSNSSAMNKFFPDSIEVTYVDSKHGFRYASHMLVGAVQRYLDQVGAKLERCGTGYKVDPTTVDPSITDEVRF